jgi:hypothetical protein
MLRVLEGEVADEESMLVIKKINGFGSEDGVPRVKKVYIIRCGAV